MKKVNRFWPLNGTKYSRMDRVKFFKVCLPKILLGPFLNILSQMFSQKMLHHRRLNDFQIRLCGRQ